VSEPTTTDASTSAALGWAGRVWWALALGWTGVVLALCLAQGTWIKAQLRWLLDLHRELDLAGPRPTDTVLHFCAFLVLGLLYACSLGRGSWARLRGGAVCVCLLALWALGGGLEWAQAFVPERTPDWKDFAANVAGVTLGLGVPLIVGTAWRRVRAGDPLLPAPWRGRP
jgi:VanZ family protein